MKEKDVLLLLKQWQKRLSSGDPWVKKTIDDRWELERF